MIFNQFVRIKSVFLQNLFVIEKNVGDTGWSRTVVFTLKLGKPIHHGFVKNICLRSEVFIQGLNAVSSAFKPLDEIFIFPPRIFVKNPTWNNFIQLGQIANNFWVPLSRYIVNSIVVSAAATVGHILFASMAAYPLSKHRFAGKQMLNTLVRLALLFTSTVTYIPQYIVMAQLGLINSQLALILPALQSSLGLYLMQSFMAGIPDEMLEAARIDAASEYRICFQVVMPNVKPAWLTLMIFSFQGIWNNTGGTLLYQENLKVLPSILGQISAGGISRAGVTSAATLVMLIPPIILFLVSQNRVIETMSTSGMK